MTSRREQMRALERLAERERRKGRRLPDEPEPPAAAGVGGAAPRAKRAYDTSNRPRLTDKASGRRGFYSTSTRWRRESAEFKREHPVCEHPGCRLPSAFTDHIHPIADPHDLDDPAIWDRANWQALCDYHHRVKTRRELGEAGKLSKMRRPRGPRVQIDPETGYPLAGQAHWWSEQD